jgi:hypothetical protein
MAKLQALGLAQNPKEEAAWMQFLTLAIKRSGAGFLDAVNALGPGRFSVAQVSGDTEWDFATACWELTLLIEDRLVLVPKETLRQFLQGFSHVRETAIGKKNGFERIQQKIKLLVV